MQARLKSILGPHLAEPLNLIEVVGGARIAVVLHVSGDALDGHRAVEDHGFVDGPSQWAAPAGQRRSFRSGRQPLWCTHWSM